MSGDAHNTAFLEGQDALVELGRVRPRWAVVLRRRVEGATLEEISAEFGVSRERVRQIEAQGRTWIRGAVGE